MSSMDPDKILRVHVVSQPNPDNMGRELRNGVLVALATTIIGTAGAIFQARVTLRMERKEREAERAKMMQEASRIVHGSSVPKENKQ